MYFLHVIPYTRNGDALNARLKNAPMIWFSWSVAEKGYEVRAGNLIAKSPPQVKAIVGLKDDFAENICLEFVGLDSDSDKICEFANQYGFLKNRSLETESLHLWVQEIEAMRDVLTALNEGRFADGMDAYIAGYARQDGATAGFVPNTTSSDIDFRCVARDFASWLWLQIGHNLRGREIARCRACQSLFFRGGGRGSRRMQSRKTKQFCSVECKTTHNNRISAQRKKALEHGIYTRK